jgi:pyruvate/2-oxoacid:ferredoxin oxidoreductase beta subunit
MQDMVAKIERGLTESKKGFAFLHILSPCPTGWLYEPDQSIQIAKRPFVFKYVPLGKNYNGNYYIT